MVLSDRDPSELCEVGISQRIRQKVYLCDLRGFAVNVYSISATSVPQAKRARGKRSLCAFISRYCQFQVSQMFRHL